MLRYTGAASVKNTRLGSEKDASRVKRGRWNKKSLRNTARHENSAHIHGIEEIDQFLVGFSFSDVMADVNKFLFKKMRFLQFASDVLRQKQAIAKKSPLTNALNSRRASSKCTAKVQETSAELQTKAKGNLDWVRRVAHAPLKPLGWVQLPRRSYRRLEKRYLRTVTCSAKRYNQSLLQKKMNLRWGV